MLAEVVIRQSCGPHPGAVRMMATRQMKVETLRFLVTRYPYVLVKDSAIGSRMDHSARLTEFVAIVVTKLTY